MLVERRLELGFLTVGLLLVLVSSCYAIDGVKASPECEWVQTSNPSKGENGAWGVAVDSSGLYMVGYDVAPGNLEWRIEKRSLTDGALLWTQVSNPSTGSNWAWGVAADASGLYVVGFDSSPGNLEWRIEKRSLTDGKLIWAQVSNPSIGEDSALGVAVDSSGLYMVGFDNAPGNNEWRIEKRNLTDGVLLWSQTSNPSKGENWACAVAVDSSGLYMVGYDVAPGDLEWRIEKRSLTDGALLWTRTSNPTVGEASGKYLGDRAWGVAIDASGLYVVGYDNSPSQKDLEWRIEKRSLTDGALLWAKTNNPSASEDRAFGVAVDSSGLYVVGFDSAPGLGDLEWSTEKRNLTDGTILWTRTDNPSRGEDWAWGVAVDSSGLYVVGFDNAPGNDEWRIEKICLTETSPFYMQTWFIASMTVLVVIAIVAAVVVMRRKTKPIAPPFTNTTPFFVRGTQCTW